MLPRRVGSPSWGKDSPIATTQGFEKTAGFPVDVPGPPNDLILDCGFSSANGSALLSIGNTPSSSGGCEVSGVSSARNLDVEDLPVSESAEGNPATSDSVGTERLASDPSDDSRASKANFNTNTRGGTDARSGRQGRKRSLELPRRQKKRRCVIGRELRERFSQSCKGSEKTSVRSEPDFIDTVEAMESETGQTSQEREYVGGIRSNPDATDPMVIEGDDGSASTRAVEVLEAQQVEQSRLPLGAAEDGTTNVTCDLCRFACASRRGLSQHQRHRHPVEYQRRLASHKPQPKRRSYERAEIALLARAEVELPLSTRFVNLALRDLDLVERTAEQIKKMRRTVAYKSLIDELRAARTRAEQLTSHSVCQSPSPRTSFGEITLPQECLGLLALYEQRKAEGWPSTTVEEFDAALRRFRPALFERLDDQRRNSTLTQQSFEDWRQPQLTRREQKRIRYATSQLLWRINRSLLMKVVLDDHPINARPPDISHVEKVYVDRFSVPKDLAVGPLSSIKQDVQVDMERALLRPIMPDEVKVVLKTLKQRSASGPDGWSVMDISSVGIHALSIVLSCWLMTRRTPRWTKRNRTTLIPKGSGDSREVSSWRPITIGPHLLRLYTKILASRLQETVKLNPLQKAFREVDGYSEHLALLHGAIREAKLRKKSIYVVFLDLAKAFDSVNHALLVRGLRRQGIPEHFIEVVRDLYDGPITRVSNGIALTEDIVIRSGVKQGCPLSPLLFNMVMDELVDELDPSFGFRLSNGGAISTLAVVGQEATRYGAFDPACSEESFERVDSP